ncbi:hypothetical protein Pst134EB_026149 [Puccinia striiformis f. sp. tritici]|uniref:Uncharacterized protein n=1 Tax=Puccinia striiformis f. sp. tritici PST-78 TaxID=1165861 RepID=A0A0L0W0U6_9BASI|nr:hypothetical protein Pst134EB_026149 [Puccinia striiformis f. sp. tritici]KNF05082.1 hypothetical protein PSTG_01714 [Puccinia striiformis f. sp. tritici PST-78]
MFVQTSLLAVYGALLTLVKGTMIPYPRARLARRMTSAEVVGERDFISAEGSEIFTHPDLVRRIAAPGEPGLTMAQFKSNAAREMSIDSKDMSRFVNHFMWPYKEDEYEKEIFTFEELREAELNWLKSQRKSQDYRDRVSRKLYKKLGSDDTEKKMSLNDYTQRMMIGKNLNPEEDGMSVHNYNELCLHLRSLVLGRYRDTAKLKMPGLLKDFMAWAKAELRDNTYVVEWHSPNGQESGMIKKLVEGLNRSESEWHWRSLLRTMADRLNLE